MYMCACVCTRDERNGEMTWQQTVDSYNCDSAASHQTTTAKPAVVVVVVDIVASVTRVPVWRMNIMSSITRMRSKALLCV